MTTRRAVSFEGRLHSRPLPSRAHLLMGCSLNVRRTRAGYKRFMPVDAFGRHQQLCWLSLTGRASSSSHQRTTAGAWPNVPADDGMCDFHSWLCFTRTRSAVGGTKMARLLLLRHGTALDEAQDPARPLSEGGHAEAEHTAHALARCAGRSRSHDLWVMAQHHPLASCPRWP